MKPRSLAGLNCMPPRMSNRNASAFIASACCCSGVMSSRIQMLRPCVATIMSLSRGWMMISWIGTVGRLDLTRVHLPPRSGLTNSPNSEPGIEHARVLRILRHRHHRVALRNALADRAEVVAAVDAGVDVGAHVVGAMVVEGRVDHVDVVRRGGQARHVRVLRHARELAGDVGPGLAVPGHVHLAVIGAGIQHAGRLRRFDQLHDVAVGLHAVVLGDGEFLGDAAHQRQRLRGRSLRSGRG